MPERQTSPTSSLSIPTLVNLSEEALQLQMEMNDTMVHLLSVRATLDACHQWLISEAEANQHQNNIATSEAIREIKAQFTTMIVNAEATMQKVEANCLASINEAKASHVAGIWKAEAANAAQASKIHLQHQ